MLQEDFPSFHYLAPENRITLAPTNLALMNQNNIPSAYHLLNNFYDNLCRFSNEFPQQSTSLSNYSSTSDEVKENQLRLIDERKRRRMISNRESARRARIRKQKQLDELWSQVVRLRTENRNLLDKLNHVSLCHDNVVRENARLKDVASELRKMLNDWQIGSPFTATALRDLELPIIF